MKTIERTAVYSAPPEVVFHSLDDLGVTGMHMTQSSWMMMGSKLKLEYLTTNHSGPGTRYRWTGNMMGFKMDFEVEVTRWIPSEEKIWETRGKAQIIIYSWYRMHLRLRKVMKGTLVSLSISYEKPEGGFYRLLSLLFADWYCKWCLKRMLEDSRKLLEQTSNKSD
ncbi:MAG TPA: SRPBCC family protein [Saprospiraceae bacterium]|nr:SRPBCC family protein [Saprospiraceae bacterium]